MRLYEVYQSIRLRESDNNWLEKLKDELSGRVVELPNDEQTVRALRDIEEVLNSAHAGGRIRFVMDTLSDFTDKDVQKAHRDLARYVLSLDVDPDRRMKMIELWRTKGLIDIDALTDPNKTTIDELSADPKNPAVQDMIQAIFNMAGLGVGKGELALVYLSPKISSPSKGDIKIEGVGTIEVKAQDAAGFRFVDEQVKPAAGYDQKATEILNLYQQVFPDKSIPTTGLNWEQLVELASSMPTQTERNRYAALLRELLEKIYPQAGTERIKQIADAVITGDTATARRRNAEASFANYAAIKKEEGYLFLDLPKNQMLFFSEPEEFDRLQFSDRSSYPVLNTGGMRNIYPKIENVRGPAAS